MRRNRIYEATIDAATDPDRKASGRPVETKSDYMRRPTENGVRSMLTPTRIDCLCCHKTMGGPNTPKFIGLLHYRLHQLTRKHRERYPAWRDAYIARYGDVPFVKTAATENQSRSHGDEPDAQTLERQPVPAPRERNDTDGGNQ